MIRPFRRPTLLREKMRPESPKSPADILHESFQIMKEQIERDPKLSPVKKRALRTILPTQEAHFKWLTETVTYGNIGTTISYALPIVKKMFAELILPNLVDVQAIDMPQAFIRFLKPNKTIGKGVDVKSEILPENFITSPKGGQVSNGAIKNTYQPYYAAGIQAVAFQISIKDDGTPDTFLGFEKGGFNRDLFTETGTEILSINNLLWRDKTSSWAELKSTDGVYMGGYIKDPNNIEDHCYAALPGFTIGGIQAYVQLTITVSTGAVAIAFGTWNGTNFTPGALDGISAVDTISVAVQIPYELEEGKSTFSGVEFNIEFIPITAVPRYLNAKLTVYSLLAGQKMGINADQELLDYNAAAMAVEVDRWGIYNLRKAALFDSAVTHRTYDAQAATAGSIYTDVSRYYSHIIKTLLAMRNEIYKKSFRGKGNFIVTSTEVSALFESLDKLDPVNTDGEKIAYAGKLNGTWDVYVDPYYVENEVLMGYNSGKNDLKAGAVYAPFLPLYLTPPDYKGDTFQFVYGVITSAGFTVYDPNCFGFMTVSNVETSV